ncbi:hypothetical protein HGRIS_001882 [Hohenbuehelia grisea]|uniref:Uncharacterized protein n=1 Tax=Hohenbuehelia grisea TaxID=104357 RepID=A0ABR3JIR1_9AGAR
MPELVTPSPLDYDFIDIFILAMRLRLQLAFRLDNATPMVMEASFGGIKCTRNAPQLVLAGPSNSSRDLVFPICAHK